MRSIVAIGLVVAGCGGGKSTSGDAPLGDTQPAIDTPYLDTGIDVPVGPKCTCHTTAPGSTRGAAIAITPDDKTLVSCNRDAGTVSVVRVDYSGAIPAMTSVAELDLGAGSEPWEVAVDACGQCAYVATRNGQKVVRIEGLATATPTVGPNVAVGSEPTAVALSPNGNHLYVANWVEGTISVVDPAAMAVTSTIDLNATLLATGLLGTTPATSRPALAHPRNLAVTNNGDANDDDESVLATEFYAQRTGPESVATADTNWEGLVYRIPVATGTATTIALPPVTDTKFNDHNNAVTGCFPNQVGAITVSGGFAWVTSTCASPKGPLGVFQKGACTVNTDCPALGSTCDTTKGACTLSCVQDTDCGTTSAAGACNVATGVCAPNTSDVKTTTHPALSIVNLATGIATTTNLDAGFTTVGSTRMPLLPSDIAFTGTFAYLTAAGADATFRVTTSAGAITTFGSTNNAFINLRTSAADTLIRLPTGIAIGNAAAFAFVADDGSRDITALSLNAQAIAGSPFQASVLPTAGTAGDHVLRGKRFFTTGLGRWSLSGAAWGSCAACHPDGLSDNVTWYFNRGPRQSVSLDGSFASLDVTDQRIFNWTGIFEEVADFEGNTRGVSGGVGAIVSTLSTPPANSDRINLIAQTPIQQGLQGSTEDIANPAGASAHPHSTIGDWGDIKAYIQAIRSPRAPVGLVAADVVAGRTLFGSGQGNCVGCHAGAKWTISKVFYAPGDTPNAATASVATTSLGQTSWNANLNGFPAALFPTAVAGSQLMRFGNPPGAEQLQCSLRPVGTFGASDPMINVLELRQDMTTAGQGNGATGLGFNPPSLLGTQVGGPFFHAGNARTLEEVFASRFTGHYQSAVAAVFAPTAAQIRQLVAFMLSVDESTAALAIPPTGNTGGSICHYP